MTTRRSAWENRRSSRSTRRNFSKVKLGASRQDDPGLQKLATEDGLRMADPADAREFRRKAGVHVSDRIIDVIDAPSSDAIETLIRGIGAAAATMP